LKYGDVSLQSILQESMSLPLSLKSIELYTRETNDATYKFIGVARLVGNDVRFVIF